MCWVFKEKADIKTCPWDTSIFSPMTLNSYNVCSCLLFYSRTFDTLNEWVGVVDVYVFLIFTKLAKLCNINVNYLFAIWQQTFHKTSWFRFATCQSQTSSRLSRFRCTSFFDKIYFLVKTSFQKPGCDNTNILNKHTCISNINLFCP